MRKSAPTLLALSAVAAITSGIALGQELKPIPANAFAPASPVDAWKKAWPRLLAAEKEADVALAEATRDVEASYALAAKNLRPFVEDILGGWGKWEYAAGGAAKALNVVAAAVDGALGSKLSTPDAPDRFTRFAREAFVSRVFDPAVFKRGIEGAVGTYVARLQAIESKLLVDLEADMPDGAFRIPKVPAPKLSDVMGAQIDAAVADLIADAGTDFAVWAGKEAMGQVGGSWLTGLVASSGMLGAGAAANNDHFSAALFGVSALVGIGVSQGLDMIGQAAGHDPIGQLVAKLQERLKKAQEAMVAGEDSERSTQYRWFALYRHLHPDAEVRSICVAAADVMESRYFLGLRPLLEAVSKERLCVRRQAAYQAIFGFDAPLPRDLCFRREVFDRTNTVVKWAKNTVSR